MLLHAHALKEHCHNQCVCLCVQRQIRWCLSWPWWLAYFCCWSWLLGVWCAASKKGDLQRGTEGSYFFLSGSVRSDETIKSTFNCCFRVCFFIDASSLPQDNPTRCFSQAAHEAAHVSGPHTSANLYLWSLQPLKPVNLCPLLLPDHILEHWSPAEQLQRWASTSVAFYLFAYIWHDISICGSCSLCLKPCHCGEWFWVNWPKFEGTTCACWRVPEPHTTNELKGSYSES